MARRAIKRDLNEKKHKLTKAYGVIGADGRLVTDDKVVTADTAEKSVEKVSLDAEPKTSSPQEVKEKPVKLKTDDEKVVESEPEESSEKKAVDKPKAKKPRKPTAKKKATTKVEKAAKED